MTQRQPANPDVVIKRIYEPVSESDGQRVLVDRIWPRGVSRTRPFSMPGCLRWLHRRLYESGLTTSRTVGPNSQGATSKSSTTVLTLRNSAPYYRKVALPSYIAPATPSTIRQWSSSPSSHRQRFTP